MVLVIACDLDLRTLYEVADHVLTLNHGATAKQLEPTRVLPFVALDDVRRHLSGREGGDRPTCGRTGIDALVVCRVEAGTALPRGETVVSLVGGQIAENLTESAKRKPQGLCEAQAASRQPPATSREAQVVERKP
jgi:hypothetical protein